MRLAKPEGYISSFIDAGAPVQRLLRMMLKQASAEDGLADYIRDLLLAFDPAVQKPAPAQSVEPLSERELEVLRYMAEGLSNPEIARRLYLSPNTLKAHAQNIFTKMNVHNRLQAVNMGKDLGLIH